MTERRRLSVTDKLSIMVRQSACPLCGERLERDAEEFRRRILAKGSDDKPKARSRWPSRKFAKHNEGTRS